MSQKVSKAERTKQFIIEQAAPIFNTKGIAGTAMSDIVEATKMAKGGIYGHFDSKETLSREVVDYNLNQLSQMLIHVISKAPMAKDKLFAYLDLFSTPLQPPVAGGCPMMNFGTEADDTEPVIKEKIKTALQIGESCIVDIIQAGIASGEFRANWEAKEFALKMFTLIEGGVMICRIVDSNSQMGAIVKMLKKEIEGYVI